MQKFLFKDGSNTDYFCMYPWTANHSVCKTVHRNIEFTWLIIDPTTVSCGTLTERNFTKFHCNVSYKLL